MTKLTSYPASSNEAQAVLAQAVGNQIRFCQADGVSIEACEHGFEESHILWGAIKFVGDPDFLFTLEAKGDQLFVSAEGQFDELGTAMGVETHKSAFIRGLGDWSNITKIGVDNFGGETLYIDFFLGGPAAFQASQNAISFSVIKTEEREYDVRKIVREYLS